MVSSSFTRQLRRHFLIKSRCLYCAVVAFDVGTSSKSQIMLESFFISSSIRFNCRSSIGRLGKDATTSALKVYVPSISGSVGTTFHYQQQRSMGHTVRMIITDDLPIQKLYKDDVVDVKAGFARNFLLPKKKGVYATRANFQLLNLMDPLLETSEQKRIRLLDEAASGHQVEEKELKAAEILKNYLSNKVLKIWRQVDPSHKEKLFPSFVDEKAIRLKLSKQLKIDLDDLEYIHYLSKPLSQVSINNEKTQIATLTEEKIETIFKVESKAFPVIDSIKKEMGLAVIEDMQQKLTDDENEDKNNIGNLNSSDLQLENGESPPTFESIATSDDILSEESSSSEETTDPSLNTQDEVNEQKQTKKMRRKAIRRLIEASNQPIRMTGEYLARITLRGGFTVPLKVEVVKR